MKILFHFSLALLLAAIGSLRAIETAAPAVPPQQYVIAISPFLDKSVRDEVFRGIVRLVVDDLPLNSKLTIYDAFDLKRITSLNLPNARVFNSSKTRANQFASAIRDVKVFLAAEHTRPTNAVLTFNAGLRLPQFLDFVSENLTASEEPVAMLLLGSPLYEDAKEPAFSMVDGYFPSDGHLQASRETTIFGFSGSTNSAPRLNLYWAYFTDPWVSDLHQEKVTRFWSLYLQRRAGQLVSLNGDLGTTLQRFCRPTNSPGPDLKGWSLNSEEKKVEMLRVSRNVQVADWITSDTMPDAAQKPPTKMVGPIKIGIRWKQNVDLDLYATPQPGTETLFFQHPRSPEGYYYKDHRSSPGREYEFIEFERPVDIRELEAAVNFYKGIWPGGAHGEVRIEFEGKLYGALFSIEASEGNQGRAGASQQEFWARLPILEILKLRPAMARRN